MARKPLNIAPPVPDADETHTSAQHLRWISKPMGARIDLADKDALYKILDEA